MSLYEGKRTFNMFSDKCIAQIGIVLLSALKSLHDRGYIHKDIKPDNILTNFRPHYYVEHTVNNRQKETAKFDKISSANKDLILIDFGSVEKYLRSDGIHRRPQ